MTSTNINIGIDGRTSSRVLKPPGGAHTDIFGAPTITDSGSSRFSRQQQKSSISECFEYKNQQINKESHENGDIKVNGDEKEVNNIINDENSKPNDTPILPTRVRVPPGGFSSSLWYWH